VVRTGLVELLVAWVMRLATPSSRKSQLRRARSPSSCASFCAAAELQPSLTLPVNVGEEL